MKKPELISPAGDIEKLKIAFMYGADAVYASTPKFSMRTREIGFNYTSLKEGIKYAHDLGKKIYLTLNTYPHSSEIEEFKKHAREVIKLNPDAIIVADPGVFSFIRENTKIPIHLSTQANTTNHLSAEFWRQQGAERIVLARELSLSDIKVISNNLELSSRAIVERSSGSSRSLNQKISPQGRNDKSNYNSVIQQHNNITIKQYDNGSLKLEAFVHGAMCMAYSGRCQISNYFVGRDPNKGACVQPCRFKYKLYGLEEEFRPGEIFPLYEDKEGSYLLNSKDLCMIEHLSELIEAGISSFKIEGRLKSIYYVGAVTNAYRNAIDLYFDTPNGPKEYKKNCKKLFEEISKTSNREFTTGFYFNKPDKGTNNYETSRAKEKYSFVGLVKKYDKKNKIVTMEVRNRLKIGSAIEILTPENIIKHKLTEMFNKKTSENISEAHSGYLVSFLLKDKVPENSFVRIKAEA